MGIVVVAVYDAVKSGLVGSAYGLAQGTALGVVGHATLMSLVEDNPQMERVAIEGGLNGGLAGAISGGGAGYQSSGIRSMQRVWET